MSRQRPAWPLGPLMLGATLTLFLLVAAGVLLVAFHRGQAVVDQQIAAGFHEDHAIADLVVGDRLRQNGYSLDSLAANPTLLRHVRAGKTTALGEQLYTALTQGPGEDLGFLALRTLDGTVTGHTATPTLDLDPVKDSLPQGLGGGRHWHLMTHGDLVALVYGTPLVAADTGAVMGTLFGGMVLNDNLSLLVAIRNATAASRVALAHQGHLIARDSRTADPAALRPLATGPAPRIMRLPDQRLGSVSPLSLLGEPTPLRLLLVRSDQASQKLAGAFLFDLALILAIVLVGALGMALMLRFLILRPVTRLVVFAQAMGTHYRAEPPPTLPIQEFNQLGVALADAVTHIRRNELWLDRLIQIGNAPILVGDAQGRVRRANPAAAALWETTPDTLTGRPLAGLSGFSDTPAMVETLESARHGRTGPPVETVSGAGRTLQWTLTPLPAVVGATGEGPAVDGVVAQGQDVTTIRRIVGELTRTNRELERFAFIATHDLQEPIRSIGGFAQLLRKRYGQKLDNEADEYLDFIVEGARRMKAMMRDVMDYSLVDTVPFVPDPVDMNTLLTQVLADLKPDAEATVTHDPLPRVCGMATQLRQVLFHLLDNALKFRHPERPARVHVAAEKVEDLWVFSVIDNGIGVPVDYRSGLFILFRRLHNQADYAGTGVGLALSRRIVERHGGTIRVEDGQEGGTAIRFTLPERSQLPAHETDHDR